MKKILILLPISFTTVFFVALLLSISTYQSRIVENSKVTDVRHELAILIRGMADEETDKLHKDVYNNEANELDKPL
jgi:hypothetical protein